MAQSAAVKTDEGEAPATRPVDKVRIGLLSASIWKNSTENGAFYNVTLERVAFKHGTPIHA